MRHGIKINVKMWRKFLWIRTELSATSSDDGNFSFRNSGFHDVLKNSESAVAKFLHR